MCGIVAMLDYNKNGFFTKDVSVFKELLIVNSLRGSHSTGVFGGRMDGEMDFAKAVGNPYDFLSHKEVEPIFNKMLMKYKCIVGHGRHATRGAISGEFAHPFQKDHITMVHNGTVFNSSLIDTVGHISDSKAICHALSKNEAIEVFQDINGAYAIIYHDSKKKALSVVRNKERPMAMGIDDVSNKVYFSSEKNILEVVAYRNGIKFKHLTNIPEDVIFTFNPDKLDWFEKPVPKKKVVVPVPSTYVPQTTPNTYNNNVRTIRITSPSTGVSVKVNDVITFSLAELIEVPARNKAQETFFQAFGYCKDFPEIETSVIIKGTEEAVIYSTAYWEGKVASIVEANKKQKEKGLLFYVYLTEAKPLNKLLLSDGTLIEEEVYKELVKDGCDCCKAAISTTDCEEVLIVDNQVLCPTCNSAFFNSLKVVEQGAA